MGGICRAGVVVFVVAAAVLAGCGGGQTATTGTRGSTAVASPSVAATPAAGEITPAAPTVGGSETVGTPAVTSPGEAPSGGSRPSVIAVDANPVSAAVDDRVGQRVGTPFDVTINVVSATEGYHVYQFKLQWDSSVLSFVSGDHLNPDNFTACFDFVPEETDVFSSCGRPGDLSTFVGQMDKLTFQCKGAGVGALHLETVTEDSTFGTVLIAPVSREIATDTVDASVDCQ
jgi:hypothetical protein